LRGATVAQSGFRGMSLMRLLIQSGERGEGWDAGGIQATRKSKRATEGGGRQAGRQAGR